MISVRIKLMGMLQSKSPENGVLELPHEATILMALERLEVDPESVHVFTVDGALTRDKSSRLSDGVELTVLPPVGGG